MNIYGANAQYHFTEKIKNRGFIPGVYKDQY